ncbi:MAG: response regulator [Nitrospina sp.]|nr:response regulator [Nitrospina sp.]MBT7178911.1 response regulator [Nitrospina sp.]
MSEKSNHKLLVVDDNKSHCELAKQLLEDSYNIKIAYGGEEAISQIYNFNPAVVLLDIRMPRLTGDELVKMIKAWKPEIHVIMVSANLTPELKEECMQNGAFDCISKPLNFEHLKTAIQKALNQ